jgi:hypothetical protein
MDATVERYLLLGLRLGRHVDGLVDAYYGPPELKERVDAEEPIEASRLVADADALLAEVGDDWLGDQARGLRTYAGVLAGERVSYSDEVEGCYGVRPVLADEAAYRAAHARLDALLPDGDSLLDRYTRWRESEAVPAERIVPLVGEVVALLRDRAAAIVELPEGEGVELEAVHDEPWWAFNYYDGDLRSRVVVNVDTLTTTDDLTELAAHEVYPGHHTERAVKEQLLVREQGLLAEAIQLVPTPQSLVAEGIAETGPGLVLDDGTRAALSELFEREGLPWDPRLGWEIREARTPLRGIGVDAALLLHEGGATAEEAQAHVERWALSTSTQAAQSVRFVTDPTWRAYAITYSAGRRLCGAYVAGDPARFRRLLTEEVRVGELLAAVSSGS